MGFFDLRALRGVQQIMRHVLHIGAAWFVDLLHVAEIQKKHAAPKCRRCRKVFLDSRKFEITRNGENYEKIVTQ